MARATANELLDGFFYRDNSWLMTTTTKRRAALILVMSMLCSCATIERNPNTAKGAGVGAAGGAATGAAVGAIVGGGKGAGRGAAIGAVLGLIGGSLVGAYMDNQETEMRQVLGAQDSMRQEQENLSVSLGSDVLFTSGKDELYPGGRQKLQQFAGVLNRYPRTNIQITGHTDNRGSAAVNDPLARNRAKAVADELIVAGVAPSRLSQRGVGASMPIATNDTAAGRAQNRRVDIIVSPDQGLQRESEQQPGGAEEPS